MQKREVLTAVQLQRFLEQKDSPMSSYAREIIAASSHHRVDPRLVVAIAGVESDFGRVCRGHNAWGWNNGRTRWRSWPEAISTYVRLISERYPNWRNVKSMARSYNPNTPQAWGSKVSSLMSLIDSTVPEIETHH